MLRQKEQNNPTLFYQFTAVTYSQEREFIQSGLPLTARNIHFLSTSPESMNNPHGLPEVRRTSTACEDDH